LPITLLRNRIGYCRALSRTGAAGTAAAGAGTSSASYGMPPCRPASGKSKVILYMISSYLDSIIAGAMLACLFLSTMQADCSCSCGSIPVLSNAAAAKSSKSGSGASSTVWKAASSASSSTPGSLALISENAASSSSSNP
jgi:hypothetical protein